MLNELHIENLAVIDSAGLEFEPGLNVITGETGAGKTILAHAIALLIGARADSGLIRPGASEASVEAIFTVPKGCFSGIDVEIDIPDDEFLAVRRRISRDGRSRAYVGGRTATLGVLAELTGRLLAFSAQHEQQRLMLASRQLEILDDYCGEALAGLLLEYRLLYDHRAELTAELSDLNLDFEARQREADLLKFQIDEIEAAGLQPGEDETLENEHGRLMRAAELREACSRLAELLTGGESEGLMDALLASLTGLEGAAGVDEDLDAIAERLHNSCFELEELGRSARNQADSFESDPARLAEVDERLELIRQLQRKYGAGAGATGGAGVSGAAGGIEEVLNFCLQAEAKLKTLAGSIGGRPALEKELAEVEREMVVLASNMRQLRSEAASRLEEEAGQHLRQLAFQDCSFGVRLLPLEGGEEDGDKATLKLDAKLMNRNGADNAEFMVKLNPGMPATPLKETASGGELSRIMLAIKSAVTASRDTASLVFDEIDAGIGGETGAAIGAKLKSLARDAQIICITHLPQIACAADANFRVVKHAEGGRTMTAVERLEGEGIVDELCRMMGSSPEDSKARAHAGELLKNSGAAA